MHTGSGPLKNFKPSTITGDHLDKQILPHTSPSTCRTGLDHDGSESSLH